MYTLIDGVDFYDKNEVDDMVKSLTGGGLPDDAVKDLNTKLAAEEAARVQADADLGARIDEEAAERAQADTNLGNRITTEEAARAQVDAALNDKIVKEASTRSNSDLMLANQIAAVEQLFTTLIGPNGFIDTDNDTVNVNDSGKSIRQIAHEEFYRQLITDADDVKQQLDTLKELADYLQDNPTVLADMYAKLGISWSLDNPTDFGSFDFSSVLAADNVDDAVLELYNTFTTMIGDLTQLTTTFKDNIVGAVNEVDNNIKTKKYVDVRSINFKLDSLAQPIVLNDGINHFLLAPTMAYNDVYDMLSKDTKAAVAICDIDFDNKLYAHLDSITETCITFCGTNCITTVPDDGSPVYNRYRDITINWHNDGTAEMLLSRDYLNSRIDTEEATRAQAVTDLGDRITAEETARAQADSDLGDRITAEETARAQADSDLDNKTNELDAKIGDLTTLSTVEKGTVVGAINSEFEWRRKNDESMEQRLTDLITAEITGIEQTCSDLDAAIKNESRVRANKDTDITTSIGDMMTLDTTNKVTLVGAINEVKALAEAGGGGGGGGGTGADTAQLEAKLNAETTAREQADEQLGTRIDTEEAARTQADTDLGTRIDTEEAARTQADIDLGTRIDTEIGNLSTLTTTEKGSVVAAINEVNGKVGTGGGGDNGTDVADSDVVVLSSNEDIISWFQGTNDKVTETSHIRIAQGEYNITFTATGTYDSPMTAIQGACKGARVDGAGAKIHITLVIPGDAYQVQDTTAHPDIVFFDRPEHNKAFWQGLHLSVLVKFNQFTGVGAAGNLTNPVWLFDAFNVSGHDLKIYYAAYDNEHMSIKPCGGVCKRNENGVYTASDICWWTDTSYYGTPDAVITTDMLGDCTLINCSLRGAFTRGDSAGSLDGGELRMCAVINCSLHTGLQRLESIFGDNMPIYFDNTIFDDFIDNVYWGSAIPMWQPYTYGHGPNGNDISALMTAISGANKYTN